MAESKFNSLIAAASVSPGSLEAVKKFLDAGEDVNQLSINKWTALALACEQNYPTIVEELLVRGADINILNGKLQNTALNVATYKGRTESVTVLLKHLAPLNINSRSGPGLDSPLHIAVTEGHIDIVKALIEHGASPSLKNKAGKSSTDLVNALPDGDKKKSLLEALKFSPGPGTSTETPSVGALANAAKSGDMNRVRNMIRGGSLGNLDELCGTGSAWTALTLAVETDQVAAVYYLLSAGSDPNLLVGQRKLSALHIAAFKGFARMTQLLVNHKVNYDLTAGSDKSTPLHLAVKGGHLECAKILVRAGADKSIIDAFKQTPLDLAVSRNDADMIKLLDPKHMVMSGTSALALSPIPDLKVLTQEERDKLRNPISHWRHAPSCNVILDDGRRGQTAGFITKDFGKHRHARMGVWINGVFEDVPIGWMRPENPQEPLYPPWFRDCVTLWYSPSIAADMKEVFAQPVKDLHVGGVKPRNTFRDVFDIMQSEGIVAFVVGGCVRDIVQEKKPEIKDIDMAIDMSTHEAELMCEMYGWKFRSTKRGLIQFGDYDACPNLEAKPFYGYNSDICSVSKAASTSGCDVWLEVICRDFTCNSLEFDPYNMTIIDATGFGVKDAQARLLRIPVKPEQWNDWFTGNPSKLVRYWKMRCRGYTAVDKETHEFILKKAREQFGVNPQLDQRMCQIYMVNMIKHKDIAAFRKVVREDMGEKFQEKYFPSSFAV